MTFPLHKPSVEHFSSGLYFPGILAGRGDPGSGSATSVLPTPSTVGDGPGAVVHVVGTTMVVNESLTTCCMRNKNLTRKYRGICVQLLYIYMYIHV